MKPNFPTTPLELSVVLLSTVPGLSQPCKWIWKWRQDLGLEQELVIPLWLTMEDHQLRLDFETRIFLSLIMELSCLLFLPHCCPLIPYIQKGCM